MPESFWQTEEGLRHIVPPGCQQPEGFDVHAELYGLTGLDSVLEFGCGVGRLSKAFLASKYLGVDVSRLALNEAQQQNPNYAFLHYVGGRLPQANTVFAWTVLLHVNDDEIEETVGNLVQAASGAVVIGEIMGRSWRRRGDPPVYNREPEEYVDLLKGAGLIGNIHQYTKPCVRYPDSHYTILVGTK